MDSFPTAILAKVLSNLGAADVGSLSASSTILRPRDATPKTINDFWRSLCKQTFKMTDERFTEWTTGPSLSLPFFSLPPPPFIPPFSFPVPLPFFFLPFLFPFPPDSWAVLYKILSRYIKKEGFYNLEEAHPWGLLFLFHFEKGKFIGEALTPRDAVPDGVFAGRDYGAAGWGGPEPSEGERLCTFDDVYYREICFVGDFDSEGALSSGTLLGEVDNKEYVCKVSPRGEQREHLHAASSSIVNVLSERAQRLGVDFWRDRAGQKISQASEPARQGLCLSEHEHGSDLESKKGITVRQREDTASRARARALAFQPRIPIYGKDLLKAVWDDKKHLEFNFVEGPKRSSFKYYEGMPIIRPGLYVGQYGSAEQYGKFASECLLIEYKTFSIVTPSAWDEIKKQVFRGGDQSDDTNIFNSIRAAVDRICKSPSGVLPVTMNSEKYVRKRSRNAW